jgi:protein-S-isoprenylcysteine O-methyltransferase Ste14
MPEPLPAAQDSAGVKAPPPLIFLGILAILAGFDRLVFGGALPLAPTWRHLLGGLCLVAAAALLLAAIGLFRRAGTRPEPWKPTSAIVSSGVYGFTRNPMYLGMALAYAGLALLFDSLLALLGLPLVVVIIDRAVIAREERYLAAKFGEEYLAYRARVRRWL